MQPYLADREAAHEDASEPDELGHKSPNKVTSRDSRQLIGWVSQEGGSRLVKPANKRVSATRKYSEAADEERLMHTRSDT